MRGRQMSGWGGGRGKGAIERAGNERARNERARNERAGNERAGNERAGNERAGNERARNERAGNERARNERAGNERAGNERAGNERAGNERAGNERAGNERAGNERARNERAGNERAGNERAGNERARNERAGNERAGNERARESYKTQRSPPAYYFRPGHAGGAHKWFFHFQVAPLSPLLPPSPPFFPPLPPSPPLSTLLPPSPPFSSPLPPSPPRSTLLPPTRPLSPILPLSPHLSPPLSLPLPSSFPLPLSLLLPPSLSPLLPLFPLRHFPAAPWAWRGEGWAWSVGGMGVECGGYGCAQGGAWCSSGEECRQRSLTALGSSRLLPATADAEGVFSDDPAINPGMHEWNMVKLAYCDGGSFAGHRTHPLPVQGGSIFIRGRAIRDAIFDHLQHRLAHAQQVVVSGCSAGGLAALLHCDHIRAAFFPALPPSAYACLPDAAIFLDRKDLGGKATARELFQAVFQFHHMAGGVSEHCINARPLHLQYECVFARHAMAYVSSRVFMVNSNYDSWNLLALLANEDADPSGDLLRNCLYRVRSCTAAQLAIIQDFRQALLESWQPFLAASDPHGAFFYSCFAHCATYHSDLWSQLTVANHTLAQAFSLWLHEEDNDGAEAKSVDCAYPCNECSIDRPEFREPAVFF
ncbi:unnamed protein product [Closterium sp. NIES-65]|nr:unnamed protein product [Closterium sp. NIES-65]